MNIDKLNKRALKMARDLQTAKSSMGLSLALSAVHFKMASIASQLSIRVDTRAGFGSAVSNFYGLALSSSGAGKSVGVSLLDNFYFKDAFDYMKKEVYPKFKAKAVAELESEGIERQLHTWTPKLSNATLSGLYAYGESYYLSKIGGINIQIDEVGDAVTTKADLFDMLLECYNNGDFPAQAKRSDANALDIDGISVNLYAFGDPTKLTSGDNVEIAFQHMLKTGYARRFVFCKDDSIEQDRTPEEIVDEMMASELIKSKREDDRNYIKSLINKNNIKKTLPLTDKGLYYFARIQGEGEKYVRENKGLEDAVKSDMLNRAFKLVKLASVYAFFDGKDEVDVESLEEAMEIIRESSIVLKSITKIKPLHERLLDRMLMEENPATSQHMLGYPFIPSTWSKKVVEIIDLAKELSSEKGYIWKEASKSGVIYYSVKEKDKETEDILSKVDKQEKEELSKAQMKLLESLYD